MSITLSPETMKLLHTSMKRYLNENIDEEIGDLKARLLLDFCIQEVGAVVYNTAVADAQTYLQARLVDLEAVCYEDEFAYWKKA